MKKRRNIIFGFGGLGCIPSHAGASSKSKQCTTETNYSAHQIIFLFTQELFLNLFNQHLHHVTNIVYSRVILSFVCLFYILEKIAFLFCLLFKANKFDVLQLERSPAPPRRGLSNERCGTAASSIVGIGHCYEQ